MPTVTLLAHTPDPQKTIAAAAKLCYSSATVGELYDGLSDDKAADFVRMLSTLGHESPLEHVSFTFGVEGVSRSFLAQMTRHRMASYSVKSQRYVREAQFDYITPPEIEADEQARTLYTQAMRDIQDVYDTLAQRLQDKHCAALTAQGVPEKQARAKAEKQAIEDARFVLPNSCETKLIMTLNVRSLLNFFDHRLCSRAQWEIRAVAQQMLRLVLAVAPDVFGKAGPPCTHGPCSEGKMTCGRIAEIRAEYGALRAQFAAGSEGA